MWATGQKLGLCTWVLQNLRGMAAVQPQNVCFSSFCIFVLETRQGMWRHELVPDFFDIAGAQENDGKRHTKGWKGQQRREPLCLPKLSDVIESIAKGPKGLVPVLLFDLSSVANGCCSTFASDSTEIKRFWISLFPWWRYHPELALSHLALKKCFCLLLLAHCIGWGYWTVLNCLPYLGALGNRSVSSQAVASPVRRTKSVSWLHNCRGWCEWPCTPHIDAQDITCTEGCRFPRWGKQLCSV